VAEPELLELPQVALANAQHRPPARMGIQHGHLLGGHHRMPAVGVGDPRAEQDAARVLGHQEQGGPGGITEVQALGDVDLGKAVVLGFPRQPDPGGG
jgi:hypothetical protein